jgi:hypothetical protein
VSRNGQGVPLGALLGVGVLAGLLTLAGVLNESRERKEGGLAGPVLDPNQPPVAGGEKVTVQDAVALLPVPFFRPNDALASDDSIRDLWFVSDEAEVYARYTSGVTLKVRPADGELSNEEWASALARDGIEGPIENVAGIDVFIVPQELPSLGSARFFLNGALVTLIGRGDFSVDELRQLAESVIAGAGRAQEERAALA